MKLLGVKLVAIFWFKICFLQQCHRGTLEAVGDVGNPPQENFEMWLLNYKTQNYVTKACNLRKN